MIRNKVDFAFFLKFCGQEPCLSHRNILPVQCFACEKCLSRGYPQKQILRQGLSTCYLFGNADRAMESDAVRGMQAIGGTFLNEL